MQKKLLFLLSYFAIVKFIKVILFFVFFLNSNQTRPSCHRSPFFWRRINQWSFSGLKVGSNVLLSFGEPNGHHRTLIWYSHEEGHEPPPPPPLPIIIIINSDDGGA